MLTTDSIDYLAIGASILGSGGGGDPYLGRLMAKQAIIKNGNVRLLSVDEVPDDVLLIPMAMMGAPAVLLEKLPGGHEPKNAFGALESYLGKKAYAVLPVEIGGINSCIPVYTAACLGLPVVDADGMGRAFPEIPMTTFTIGGVKPWPMICCDEHGNKVIIEAASNSWVENLSRQVTISMGLSCTIGLFCMNGKTMKHSSVRNTLSFAIDIGKAVIESKSRKTDPIGSVLDLTKGFRLFDGKVKDVQRDLQTGFMRGRALFEGINSCTGKKFELEFQNENLMAMIDGVPKAMVPDIITVLDAETAEPITTESLRYGQRAVVIGIPCADVWRSNEGLKLVGPRYFKYGLDYVPIEDLI